MEFTSEEQFNSYAAASGRSFVSFKISQGEKELGDIVLELFSDICPRTCENFINLTSGKHPVHRYKGSPIHRVVPKAFIQVGPLAEPQFGSMMKAIA
jgi:cyclophilin family peptidyl-prolyl cis-trans isomerase